MNTCHKCQHAIALPTEAGAPDDLRLCYGAPPTVCMVPMQRSATPAERMQNPQMPAVVSALAPQFHRPLVNVNDRACGLFKEGANG